MRLIDADTLSELLVKTYEKAPTENALLFVALLLKNSEQVPTVEERPQGEWIKFPTNHSIIQCSECTALLNNLRVDVFKDKIGKMNFCPNCGADMRPKPNQLRDCENCVHHSDNGCEVWECEFEKRSDV